MRKIWAVCRHLERGRRYRARGVGGVDEDRQRVPRELGAARDVAGGGRGGGRRRRHQET
jgi:hypothetical protein